MNSSLHDVALVDFPVARFLQMQEHHDAMQREFALITMRADEPGAQAPSRLRALAAEMQRGDSGGDPFRQGVAAAAERGDVVVTLDLRIPFTALRWTEDALMLFEEGDEFARSGHLLTPPSPPEVVEFRRWLVGELIRQVRDGATPTPFWAESL